MTKAEQIRLTAWRLKVLRQAADDGNVARACRRFGISRKSFYKWKRRHAELGEAGLCDRARTPRCSPRATERDVVSKILYLRQQSHFGAGRIAAYLLRFHAIAIATSSVHRILTRHGMPRLPANQKHTPHSKRWQRYENPQPGHRLPLDVKCLERIPGTPRRLYQFTAIDDCTFHDCRHHSASRLVQAGVDLNTVRELLGHSDLKMVLRYAHLAPENTAAAVAKLVSR